MNKYKFLILAIVFLIANASSVFACTCEKTNSFDEVVERSQAVFSGKVIKIQFQKAFDYELKKQSSGEKIDYKNLVVIFEVGRWWKGGTTTKVSLVTDIMKSADGIIAISNCEYKYVSGKEYLVFAGGDKNQLVSGACTPTKLLNKANKELELLGEGREPAQ